MVADAVVIVVVAVTVRVDVFAGIGYFREQKAWMAGVADKGASAAARLLWHWIWAAMK